MTPRQRVGQVFMVGFDGLEASEDLVQFVTEYAPGGVIYFARNVQSPHQVTTLTNALQEAAGACGPPLLVSTDQEGGIVARFTEREGFAVPPSARAYGVVGDAAGAREAARCTAEQLRAVGVNMNFAPVLDVNNNPDNPVIGVRSFGGRVDDVTSLGVAQVEGYQAGLPRTGVLATGKHFPGHGNTRADSHHHLPRIDRSLEDMEAVELAPFRAAVAAGCGVLMTAHIDFPALEPGGSPATLSRRVVTGLLRERLGYAGLVVTDCMEMAAVAQRFSPGEAAVRALEAGVDMVLYSHTRALQIEALEAVVTAVESGRLSPDRLKEAVCHVLEAKRRLGLDSTGGLVDAERADSLVGTTAHRVLVAEHAQRAVTVVEAPRPLGAWTSDTRVQLVVLDGAQPLAVETVPGHPVRGLASRLGERVQLRTSTDPLAWGTVSQGDEPDEVLVVTPDAWRRPGQKAALQRLLHMDCPVTHVSLRGTRDLDLSAGRANRVCVYDSLAVSIDALAKVLVGQTSPTR